MHGIRGFIMVALSEAAFLELHSEQFRCSPCPSL
jgi:hypothetical protein